MDLQDLLGWEAVARAGEVPLLLVRHGRTAANAERRFVGCSDPPLDSTGVKESQIVAGRLSQMERGGLYASPLERARETARALGPPVLVEALQELDQGELEGKRFEEVHEEHRDFFVAWERDPTHVRVPGGESLGECRDRALAALLRVARAHVPGPPVILVTHQLVMATLVLTALGLPLRFWRMVKHGNTALDLLGFSEKGGLVVHRLNDTAHLAP